MKTLMNLLLVCMALGMVFTSCSLDKDFNIKPSLSIGDFHEGGIIFLLDDSGDHGLVCDIKTFDLLVWGCRGTKIAGANSAAIGAGAQNTSDIVAGCRSSAAFMATDVTINDFSDWFLPSKGELNEMFRNKESIDSRALTLSGGTAFINSTGLHLFWSSTESSKNSASAQSFSSGSQFKVDKNDLLQGRLVRAF